MGIVCFASLKGGVGKTTSTINLGYALKNLDKKVLLVDFDTQGSLTKFFGHDL